VESFLTDFGATVKELRADMEAAKAEDVEELDAQAKWARSDDLSKGWMRNVQGLSELVASASLFLPAYDARQCQKTIQDLLDEIDEVKSLIAPRKRFSFAARRRIRRERATMGSQASSAAGDAGAAAAAKAAALAKYAADELTVEAKAGEEVVVGADEVGSVGGSVGKDLRLLNLTDCVVYM
jgi:hypothetical protein